MRTYEAELERREIELFASRVRLGLLVWLATAVVFVVSDEFNKPEVPAAIQIARLSNIFAAAAWFYLGKERTRTQVEAIAVLMVLLGIIALAVTTATAPDSTASFVLFSVLILGAATVVPWRFECQIIVVTAGLVALATAIVFTTGSLHRFHSEPMVAVFVSFAASLFIVRVLEAQRKNTNKALVQIGNDAEISRALARVGHELIASLDEPALLQHLCALTAEVFGCDLSFTFLANKDENFDLVAGVGQRGSEDGKLGQSWRCQRREIGPLLREMDAEGVARRRGWPPAVAVRAVTPEQQGSMRALYFPLRKSGEIVGFQAALYRGREDGHRGADQLARGMSHLASLALATARLVDELECANRFKTDFLANMSHELRTPLNVIIGYGEMLVDGAFGPLNESQQDIIQHLSRAAQGQLELISATLQLSRFESSDVPLNTDELELEPFLNDLERDTQLVTKGSGLDVSWDVALEGATIRTDVVKLKMVLKNLIDNAVKFTDHGGIRVCARCVGDGFEFSIEDSGPGIPPDAREVIFEAFRQVDGPDSGNRGGVGIGLYIVKRLVDALGGRIDLDSTIGEGTTFSVWIPGASPGAGELSLKTA